MCWKFSMEKHVFSISVYIESCLCGKEGLIDVNQIQFCNMNGEKSAGVEIDSPPQTSVISKKQKQQQRVYF